MKIVINVCSVLTKATATGGQNTEIVHCERWQISTSYRIHWAAFWCLCRCDMTIGCNRNNVLIQSIRFYAWTEASLSHKKQKALNFNYYIIGTYCTGHIRNEESANGFLDFARPYSNFQIDCRKTKFKHITEPITNASYPPFSANHLPFLLTE